MKHKYRYRIIDRISEMTFVSEWTEYPTEISTSMFNGDGYCLGVSNIEVVPLEEGIEIVIYQDGKVLDIHKTN